MQPVFQKVKCRFNFPYADVFLMPIFIKIFMFCAVARENIGINLYHEITTINHDKEE